MNRFEKLVFILTVINQLTCTFCFLNCKNGCHSKVTTAENQYFCDDGEAKLSFPSWMSKLSNNLRLTKMSIPGTHDTAARATISLAETQSMTITQQLNAGIRAFDIRCRHIDNVFTMHHDRVFLKMTFSDVLDMSCKFLQSNPGEMIIMRIKEEWNARNVSRSFQDTLKLGYIHNPAWSSFIQTRSQLGMLGDYRRKILLLNDHDRRSVEFGFSWSAARIQDVYELPLIATPQTHAEWKMAKVEEHLIASNNDKDDHLYINFSSAQRALVVTPKCLAKSCGSRKGVNELATNLLANNPNNLKKTGLFMMDYPGSALIKQILSRN